MKKAKMVVLTDFKGLKVKEITVLRKDLQKGQTDCAVTKKTLMARAFKEIGLDLDAKALPGDIIGINLGYGDEMAPAKIISAFAKTHEAMKILGGIMDNKFIDAALVKVYATLPSKEQLLAQAVGSIAAPLRGLVTVLAGNLRGFVQVLNAYKDKKPA